jgi:ribosomal protein L24
MGGDRVRMVSGTLKGGWGWIAEVKLTSVFLIWEDDSQDIHEVLIQDVCRLFRLGDFVQILYRPNRGDQGFIVHHDTDDIVVYKRYATGTSDDQLGGYEVSEFLACNFDWMRLTLS